MIESISNLTAEDKNLALKRLILKEGWTLHERLRHAKSNSCTRDPSEYQSKMKHWSNAIAPDQPDNFNKRLDWDGLTLGHAAWALEPTENSIPEEPEWWNWLNELREGVIRHENQQDHKGKNFNINKICNDQPFVHVWHPIAVHLMNRIQTEYQQCCNNVAISITAWQGLAESFLYRICECSAKALWEMFNSSRTTGSLLVAHLKANGYEAELEENNDYVRFVNECINNGYENIFSEYPVLGRLVATISRQWYDMCKELTSRIKQDFLELQCHFKIPNESILKNIKLGLSDPHNNGRSVAVIEFSKNGNSCFIVYKPKDLRLDKAYHELLAYINSVSCEQYIKTLGVITKGSYGYMEFVEHHPCKNQAELNSFYFNAGRIMAILYLLGCTDCHYENLIASGDQLVLIDTETLLESNYVNTEDKELQFDTIMTAAQVLLQDSVLRSGLLPQWTLEGDGNKIAFDVSALGIEPPAKQRFKQGWSAVNSDLMIPALITEESTLPASLPLQREDHQRLYEFTDQLCEGFRRQLTEVIQKKQELSMRIAKFQSLPRRLVARPTRLYYKIYRQMIEPASLRNAVDHGIKLELLSRCFIIYEHKPKTWVLFSDEVFQMAEYDIPFFDHRVNDKNYSSKSQSQEPINNFFTGNGIESARKRIEKLEESIIVFQQKLIRGSIEARFATVNKATQRNNPDLENKGVTNVTSCDDDPREIYGLAKVLCEEIWQASLLDQNGRPEWLGMILSPDSERFHFGFVDSSLYSGSIGIAVAFARLAQLSEQHGEIDVSSIWLKRASQCIDGFLELSEKNPSNLMFRLTRDRPYGLIGTSGMLLGLNLLTEAGISNASVLYSRIIDSINIDRIKESANLDILSGISGLIGPLIKNSQAKSNEIAMVCGNRLLMTQLENGGWPQFSIPRVSSNKPLTGFGHGAAGIAASLLSLAKETGHQAYADGAIRGIEYERSTFDSEQRNWPDFRVSELQNRFMMGWCHGAPGILVSRLVMNKYNIEDDQTLLDISNARISAIAKLDKLDVSAYPAHLCCGASSLISILLIDSWKNKQPLPQVVKTSIQGLCLSLKQNKGLNFFRVNNQSINVPGLFTGKAGVALMLLEYASAKNLYLASLLSAGLL